LAYFCHCFALPDQLGVRRASASPYL
jgi:hypothetical protein